MKTLIQPLLLCMLLAAYCSLQHPPLHGSVLGPVISPPGGVIRFTCNPGYRLIGINSAMCLRRPQGYYDWNSEVPLCQGELAETTTKMRLKSIHNQMWHKHFLLTSVWT